MNEINSSNEMRDMMTNTYGHEKTDKSKELNESMSIVENQSDEYENKIFNLGSEK